jgi:hypothetical protein
MSESAITNCHIANTVLCEAGSFNFTNCASDKGSKVRSDGLEDRINVVVEAVLNRSDFLSIESN